MKILKSGLLILLIHIFSIPLNMNAQEMKVMTYNIFHGELRYDSGKSNLDQIAEVINKYKPDFVALQEVDSMTQRSAAFNDGVPQNLVQELAGKTNMYGYFGKAMDYSNGGYGEGILSKLPVETINYNLPIPHGGEVRALLLAFHTLPNGQKIIFGGTHLCHEFAENKLAQAVAISEIINRYNYPVMLGGDFNFRPDTPPYKQLTGFFDDAAVLYGHPQNTISFENPRARIDYIFISKGHQWRIKDVEVVRANPSDHMPVLVTLELLN